MVLRRLARHAAARRFPAAAIAAEAVGALIAGRRRTGLRLLVLAAVALRWSPAGVALEVGRRLARRRSR